MKNRYATQSEYVLAYMKQHGSITPVEALDSLGCFRLAARIYELRAEGHDIRVDRIDNGKGSTYASYSLANRGQ